ncbi:MAG: deoxynucleoside kinase, partial [Anaerolineae bacterium]|nr:deoxynucleoside kinase [Anaerolineae bacterium]
MARNPYIAIEGVIGVGKTTLARYLQTELNADLLLEVFEENPFLSNFYGDRDRYGFQTQIFFLLSRYRQQSATLPTAIRKGPVVADYTFAKDSLFAHLNLRGDELMMYERVYSALGEQARRPDLLVFLRADLDVLLGRIAQRDRPYERNMDPNYIDQLRVAYEDFVTRYTEAPVLVIDTNNLNIVQNADDRALVLERIKSQLEYGTYQARLLPDYGDQPDQRTPETILNAIQSGPQRLSDFQEFHLSLDAEKGFDPDIFFNFILLSEEIGELARVLKEVRMRQSTLASGGVDIREATRQAVTTFRSSIQDELADCLA